MTWHAGGRLSFGVDNKHRNIFMVVSSHCLEKHDNTPIILRYHIISLSFSFPLSPLFLSSASFTIMNVGQPRPIPSGCFPGLGGIHMTVGARPFFPANWHCYWEIKQYIPPASSKQSAPWLLFGAHSRLARIPLANAVLTQADLNPMKIRTGVSSLDGYWVFSARA